MARPNPRISSIFSESRSLITLLQNISSFSFIIFWRVGSSILNSTPCYLNLVHNLPPSKQHKQEDAIQTGYQIIPVSSRRRSLHNFKRENVQCAKKRTTRCQVHRMSSVYRYNACQPRMKRAEIGIFASIIKGH